MYIYTLIYIVVLPISHLMNTNRGPWKNVGMIPAFGMIPQFPKRTWASLTFRKPCSSRCTSSGQDTLLLVVETWRSFMSSVEQKENPLSTERYTPKHTKTTRWVSEFAKKNCNISLVTCFWMFLDRQISKQINPQVWALKTQSPSNIASCTQISPKIPYLAHRRETTWEAWKNGEVSDIHSKKKPCNTISNWNLGRICFIVWGRKLEENNHGKFLGRKLAMIFFLVKNKNCWGNENHFKKDKSLQQMGSKTHFSKKTSSWSWKKKQKIGHEHQIPNSSSLNSTRKPSTSKTTGQLIRSISLQQEAFLENWTHRGMVWNWWNTPKNHLVMFPCIHTYIYMISSIYVYANTIFLGKGCHVKDFHVLVGVILPLMWILWKVITNYVAKVVRASYIDSILYLLSRRRCKQGFSHASGSISKKKKYIYIYIYVYKYITS